MYKYLVKHHKKPAKTDIKNKANLTPLTLASKLGRQKIFKEMLELNRLVSKRTIHQKLLFCCFPTDWLTTKIGPTPKKILVELKKNLIFLTWFIKMYLFESLKRRAKKCLPTYPLLKLWVEKQQTKYIFKLGLTQLLIWNLSVCNI